MKNIAVALIITVFLGSCGGKRAGKAVYNKPAPARTDSVNKRKAVNPQSAKTNPPVTKHDEVDDDSPTPTFKEVLAERVAAYSAVENTEDMVIDGKDTLRMHLKYYCLHDSSLTVPEKYMEPWGEKDPKGFVTNNFASKIIILKNKDTVFNKIIKKNIFNGILEDPLKKYAVLLTCDYEGYNKAAGEFAFRYSITIPMTDVGVPASIVVDKTGHYRVLDEYANTDGFKKN